MQLTYRWHPITRLPGETLSVTVNLAPGDQLPRRGEYVRLDLRVPDERGMEDINVAGHVGAVTWNQRTHGQSVEITLENFR